MRLIGQRVEFCFFIACQVYPDIGTGDIINTRLMETEAHVGCLAACVWISLSNCPEKPLGDQERSKRMRIEESTFLVTSVPRLEVE